MKVSKSGKLRLKVPCGEDGNVDGRNPANQVIDSLSHYFQGFIHPRWCRISSINSRLATWLALDVSYLFH